MESPVAVYDTILKLWELEAQQFSRSNNQLGEDEVDLVNGNFSSNFMQQQIAATGSGNTCRDGAVEISDPVGRAAKVFCQGALLEAVQNCHIFDDCKEFVDMPMRVDPEEILEAFSNLSEAARDDAGSLLAFVHHYFLEPGSDLVPHNPVDYHENPVMLGKLANHEQYRKWAAQLNSAWQDLARKTSEDVDKHPQRYSILRRSHPLIVPGGRFRESYYWDSYWIVLGLLAVDMKQTALGVTRNIMSDIINFGFVPNGGRIYYLNRSQPPVLSEMVMALLQDDAGFDLNFLGDALSALEIEYQFWMRVGEHAVIMEEDDKKEKDVCLLNRYWTNSTSPRPESYREDLHDGNLSGAPSEFYANIAAGAESGWDFSSRWINRSKVDTYDLHNIEVTSVLPVDLNTFLYRMEKNVAQLCEYMYDPCRWGKELPSSLQNFKSSKAQSYSLAAARRAAAMKKFMWCDESKMWKDAWVTEDKQRVGVCKAKSSNESENEVLSSSNFFPLWGGLMDGAGQAQKEEVLEAFLKSGLMKSAGVSTTNQTTPQQWDEDNAWSPIQHLIIEGVMRLELPKSQAVGMDLTRRWLESNYQGWLDCGYMYEKYKADEIGKRGEGGEYLPQVGFGWSNGVVLHFLKEYGDQL